MKTHEEIKKGLECCVARLSCEGCPYYTGDPSCLGKMRKDLFFLIQQLERERDAADMKRLKAREEELKRIVQEWMNEQVEVEG